MASRKVDLTGQMVGGIEVLSAAPSRRSSGGHPQRFWLCRCICGREWEVNQSTLRCRKPVETCGCVRNHGMKGTPEYAAWSGMRDRCSNSNNKFYADYGGRGITVCASWQSDFENFFADMGPRPSPRHSIDRIDNNGDYEPSNCRWATKKEQTANRRAPKNSRLVDGLTIGQWAWRSGNNVLTIRSRLEAGMDPQDAIWRRTSRALACGAVEPR